MNPDIEEGALVCMACGVFILGLITLVGVMR